MSSTNVTVGWFLPALTIVFVIAKVTEHIDWSWWWVFAPMWLPFTVIMGVAALLWIIAEVLGWIADR